MCNKNIPIFLIQGWKQMVNASIVHLEVKYHELPATEEAKTEILDQIFEKNYTLNIEWCKKS